MIKGIIPWRPFEDLDKFFEEEGGWLIKGELSPAVDIYQKDDKVIVETPVVDIDPEKLDISIEDNILTISGKTEKKEEIKKEDYYRREIRRGSFYRSVSLPVKVKENEAEATYKKGILKIEIPRAEESRARKVSVKVKN